MAMNHHPSSLLSLTHIKHLNQNPFRFSCGKTKAFLNFTVKESKIKILRLQSDSKITLLLVFVAFTSKVQWIHRWFVTNDEEEFSMDHNGVKAITHASAFFAPFLVPLVVWLLMQDREVKSMALQALLFHVLIGVLIGISWALSFLLIGIPFLVIFGLMGIYYPIKGIIYSIKGRPFHYPFLGSIAR
jgi:hypothetical protein